MIDACFLTHSAPCVYTVDHNPNEKEIPLEVNLNESKSESVLLTNTLSERYG